jgi:hypothetical protein
MTVLPLSPPRPLAALLLAGAIAATSLYVNLSFTVANPAHYRYFPPFRSHVNANTNAHLGGEYFNMARSMVAGEGFAHPFDRPTGPTAWQPPVLPAILTGLLWTCGGNRSAVMVVVIVLQVQVLIWTGLLVLALARQTVGPGGTAGAAVVFFTAMLCDFRWCFQTTHDCWLVLLAMDGLLACLCWARPLSSWRAAAVWGLFGGVCVLINPVVGFAWAGSSMAIGLRQKAWSRLGVALLAAWLTLVPWMVRNYLVFGRLIPSKSNLAYELYQSQCLQPDGLIQATTFARHPYISSTPERQQYQALGETAYLDRKWQQFWDAVRHKPADFAGRVADRFLGATLWYVPFDRAEAARRPWQLLLSRLAHPWPFLGLLVLLVTAIKVRLHWIQWMGIGVYLLYMLPYVGASYYERYAVPLIGVKVLLVLWAAGPARLALSSSITRISLSRPAPPPPLSSARQWSGSWEAPCL